MNKKPDKELFSESLSDPDEGKLCKELSELMNKDDDEMLFQALEALEKNEITPEELKKFQELCNDDLKFNEELKELRDWLNHADEIEPVDKHFKRTIKNLNSDLEKLEQAVLDDAVITCPHCGKKISEIS